MVDVGKKQEERKGFSSQTPNFSPSHYVISYPV